MLAGTDYEAGAARKSLITVAEFSRPATRDEVSRSDVAREALVTLIDPCITIR